MTGDLGPTAPSWFVKAVQSPCRRARVEVEGCPIHYLSWGEAGKPGVLLVHGNRAHARWWAFVAPLLADEFHLAALDLSGNGDSGYRDTYTGDHYAAELMGVIADAGLGPRPVITGHSFGGTVTLRTAVRHGGELAGIVIADAMIGRTGGFGSGRGSRPKRVYPTYEEARARFRLIPEQPCDNGYILDYVAYHSLKEVEGGWTWKFHERTHEGVSVHDAGGSPYDLACPVAAIWGAESIHRHRANIGHMEEIVHGTGPIVAIPSAHHHIMLDEPQALADALRGILRGLFARDGRPKPARAMAEAGEDAEPA